MGKGSVLRVVTAVLATLFTGLVAAGSWIVGQGQYLDDYCSTRAPQPRAPTPEALDGRPAYLDGPVTVRCDYHDLPAVVVTDALPLAGALVLAALVLTVAFLTFRWALGSASPGGGVTGPSLRRELPDAGEVLLGEDAVDS